MRDINTLVIHCSATPAKNYVDAAVIDRWHRAKGWLRIGYHYVIKRDGELEKGRDISVVGAHVEGHNAKSIGICMVGGMDADNIRAENNFTHAQWATLKTLVYQLMTSFPDATVLGHRDFPNVHKDCPSFDVRTWLKENQLDGS